MKVERNSPVRSTRSVAQAAYARRIEATGEVDDVDASASVLGIPEEEFTPRVRDAIMGLMGEVDELRDCVRCRQQGGRNPRCLRIFRRISRLMKSPRS